METSSERMMNKPDHRGSVNARSVLDPRLRSHKVISPTHLPATSQHPSPPREDMFYTCVDLAAESIDKTGSSFASAEIPGKPSMYSRHDQNLSIEQTFLARVHI